MKDMLHGGLNEETRLKLKKRKTRKIQNNT